MNNGMKATTWVLGTFTAIGVSPCPTHWRMYVHTARPHPHARLLRKLLETRSSPHPAMDTLLTRSGFNTPTQPGHLGPDFSVVGAPHVDTLHVDLSSVGMLPSPCSGSEKTQVNS